MPTTQDQFESEVRASHTITLDALDRYFQAWLHAGYHEVTHSATGQTPHTCFREQTRFRRSVNMSDALELFHHRKKRKVDNVFCDVQINKQFFAVDVKYRGDRVLVGYDPFSRMKEGNRSRLEERKPLIHANKR